MALVGKLHPLLVHVPIALVFLELLFGMVIATDRSDRTL
jgi:uncharacterized membrane protein